MARYCGKLGFVKQIETKPGTWTEDIEERTYYGDVLRNIRRFSDNDSTNANVSLGNEISIVADPYAISHCHMLRYFTYHGIKWTVSSIDIQPPRIIVTPGGLYNENS